MNSWSTPSSLSSWARSAHASRRQSPNEVLAEVARNLGVDYGVEAVAAEFSEGYDWLVRACARLQQQQVAARDVAVTARNPSEFTATVKVSSKEPPGSSTFDEDWPAFELEVAESGFALWSKTDDSHEGRIDLIVKLSFTA